MNNEINFNDTQYSLLMTKMSCGINTAHLMFEESEVQLQHILITEYASVLDNSENHKSVEKILDRLEGSAKKIAELTAQIDSILSYTASTRFVESSKFDQSYLLGFGESLWSTGLVDKDSWNVISEIMSEKDGFKGVLNYFKREATTILKMTETLTEMIRHTMPFAQNGTLHLVLDENQPDNFTMEFAKLDSAWDKFKPLQTAFKLLLVELSYRENGTGSLFQKDIEERKTA